MYKNIWSLFTIALLADLQDDEVIGKPGELSEMILGTEKLKIGEPPLSTTTYNATALPVVSKIVTAISTAQTGKLLFLGCFSDPGMNGTELQKVSLWFILLHKWLI